MLRAVALFLKPLLEEEEGARDGMWFFDFLKGFFYSCHRTACQSQRPLGRNEEHPVPWDESVLAEISPREAGCRRQLWSLAGVLHMRTRPPNL